MSKRGAVEEVPAMESTNDQQPEQKEPALTTDEVSTQPEATALVPAPAEPEVIEGVVIEIEPPEAPKDHPPQKEKPYWLLIPFTIFCCLVFVAVSSLLPLLTPSATVTIIPVERSITTTATIEAPGRALLSLTLMQSASVPATGKRHQDAIRAIGTITFYNGLFTSQTITAGTIFTASNGVQIITDQPAVIPAGNPPSYGQVTVSAHAIIPGPQGNIQAFAINTACCATSVLAKNTEAFTGGQNARDYLVVTKADIASAEATITAILGKSERAALEAQLNIGEGLVTPPCSKKVQSDHKIGVEAAEVTVSVSQTCSGIAYLANVLHQNATQLLQQEAIQRLGTGYNLIGDLQVHVLTASITDHTKGIATIAIQVDATYVYQLSQAQKQHITHLIAGKTKQQALTTLLQLPGLQGALFTIKGNAATLPDDPGRITIAVVKSS